MFSKKTIYADTVSGFLSASGSNSASHQIDVSYNEKNQVLVVNWEGEVSSEEVRQGYDVVMEQVRSLKPRKLLLDFHNRVMIRRKDQKWVFSTVFPNILRTVGDNVFVAIVLPVALYYGLVAELNGDELMHDNNFLIIHHSLYREEAYRWLDTMCLPNTSDIF